MRSCNTADGYSYMVPSKQVPVSYGFPLHLQKRLRGHARPPSPFITSPTNFLRNPDTEFHVWIGNNRWNSFFESRKRPDSIIPTHWPVNSWQRHFATANRHWRSCARVAIEWKKFLNVSIIEMFASFTSGGWISRYSVGAIKWLGCVNCLCYLFHWIINDAEWSSPDKGNVLCLAIKGRGCYNNMRVACELFR